MSDWIAFVNCYRNDPANKGITMNQAMIECRKLWKDPNVKDNFIRSLHSTHSTHSSNSDNSSNSSKSESKKKSRVQEPEIEDSSDSEVEVIEVKPKRKYTKKSVIVAEPVVKDKEYYKNKYKRKYQKK